MKHFRFSTSSRKVLLRKICFKCNNYKKFKNPKVSYIFNNSSNDIKIFKKEQSIEILKIIGLIDNKKVKFLLTLNFVFNRKSLMHYINSLSLNMAEENVSLNFR